MLFFKLSLLDHLNLAWSNLRIFIYLEIRQHMKEEEVMRWMIQLSWISHDSFLRYGSSKFFLVLSLLSNDCLKIKSPKFLNFSFLLTHIWERRGRYERIYYLSRMGVLWLFIEISFFKVWTQILVPRGIIQKSKKICKISKIMFHSKE